MCCCFFCSEECRILSTKNYTQLVVCLSSLFKQLLLRVLYVQNTMSNTNMCAQLYQNFPVGIRLTWAERSWMTMRKLFQLSVLASRLACTPLCYWCLNISLLCYPPLSQSKHRARFVPKSPSMASMLPLLCLQSSHGKVSMSSSLFKEPFMSLMFLPAYEPTIQANTWLCETPKTKQIRSYISTVTAGIHCVGIYKTSRPTRPCRAILALKAQHINIHQLYSSSRFYYMRAFCIRKAIHPDDMVFLQNKYSSVAFFSSPITSLKDSVLPLQNQPANASWSRKPRKSCSPTYDVSASSGCCALE